MVTIKDVAKLAGVSTTTVSVVLNTAPEEKKVALKTREKVNQAIKAVGYQPNIAARRLRGNDDVLPVIAIFWPLDYRVNFLGQVLKQIKVVVDRAYFKCELVVYPFINNELDQYREQFETETFQGAFLGALSKEDMAFLQSFESKIPMVFYNRYLEGQHSVGSDNRMAGSLAADLISKNGGRSVTIFQYAMEEQLNSKIRLEAFVESCGKKGITIKRWVEIPYDDKDRVVAETELAVNEGALGDVCLYLDELTAYSSLFTLQNMGIHVPDTVKLLLLNTTSTSAIGSYVKPEITRVDFDVTCMLEDCARILIHNIQQPGQKEIHKIYQPKIVYGDTF